MKKLFFVLIFLFTGMLFSMEYKFTTDLQVNKILRASINGSRFVFVSGENEDDFSMFINESDKYAFLFTDKQSYSALKTFVEAINKKADERKVVKEISIGNTRWRFEYDDSFLSLVKRDHFVFIEG